MVGEEEADNSSSINRGLVLAACNAWQKGEFNYGTKDCVTFTVHMIRELHGLDYSEHLLYNNEKTAQELIYAAGGFVELIDSVLGPPSKESLTGHPVMFDAPITGLTMGVKLDRSIICITRRGLSRIPAKYIVRSWICPAR